MNIRKADIVFDIIFTVVLAICVAAVLINKSPAAAEVPNATYEPTKAETTEPTETEPPVTEVTDSSEVIPAIPLYDVPLDAELQLHIIHTCEEKHIDPAIIVAMAFRESTYRVDAIGDGGNSYGLLQVQPRWHYWRMQKLGCTDLLDPFQNVTVAVDYLAEQIDRYGGDLAKGLTAYHAGSYKGTVTQYARDVMAKAEELAASTYIKAVDIQ